MWSALILALVSFVSLPFLLHADLAHGPALLTGLILVLLWNYCFAF